MTLWALKTDTRYGKLPFALTSVNSTVFGSTALADLSSMTPFRPALPAATRRPIVATTSSAVKSLPSCHLTFLRRLNVQTLLSPLGVHFSASPGPMSFVWGSSAARNSNDWATSPYAARSCMLIGSNFTGRWTATLIVPPVFAAPDAAAPLAPALPAGAPDPGADDDFVPVSQAAMTALIDAID